MILWGKVFLMNEVTLYGCPGVRGGLVPGGKEGHIARDEAPGTVVRDYAKCPLQGYLAHKNPPPLLGLPIGPRYRPAVGP